MEPLPAPQELAYRLLHHAVEGDSSPAIMVAAAEFTHEQLRTGLSVFIGQTGFDSLWARAISRVPQGILLLPSTGEEMHSLSKSGWSDALDGCTSDEIRSLITFGFTSFIGLFFTFVGVEVGCHLLVQIWPELV